MSKYNSLLDIKDILNDYCQEIQDNIAENAEAVAKDAVNKLKTTSPQSKRNTKHKGRYAKGWTKKIEKGRYYVHTTVYNRTDYQLTHLLENGHLNKNGGKVKPQVHIYPVEQECIKAYEKGVERAIKNGGK